MLEYCKLASFVLALPLCAAVASASSPTPPVEARLLPDGPGAVRLVIATTASGDYAITVRKTGTEPAGEPKALSKPLGEGIVRKESSVVLRDGIAKDVVAGNVIHVNYQVEVVNADRGYHGFVVVDQAFTVESDGTLRPITFEQELELASGPAPAELRNGEIAAGVPSLEPRQ